MHRLTAAIWHVKQYTGKPTLQVSQVYKTFRKDIQKRMGLHACSCCRQANVAGLSLSLSVCQIKGRIIKNLVQVLRTITQCT